MTADAAIGTDGAQARTLTNAMSQRPRHKVAYFAASSDTLAQAAKNPASQ
jgi:hypothetical protein